MADLSDYGPLSETKQNLENDRIKILEEENLTLRRHIESSTKSEQLLREVVEGLIKERDNHKRIRKAITRQLKDVEKARKYEFGLYLERFQVAQDVIKSLKVELEQLKQTTTTTWKFWR